MNKNTLASIEYSAAHASFWMCLCVYVSFAAVYLQALGYTNAQLGIVIAAGNVLSFLVGVAISSLIDRYPEFRAGDAVNIMLAVQMVTLAVLWFCSARSMLTSVTYVLLLGFAMSVSSMLIKQWSDLLSSGLEVSFGTARAIGSGGYVILAAFIGKAVELWSVKALLVTALALTFVQIVLNYLLNRKTTAVSGSVEPGVKGTPLPVFMRENKPFMLFLAGLVLVFIAHNTSGSYFINIVRNLGGGTAESGYVNSLIALVEVPVMLLYHRICRGRTPAAVVGAALVLFPLKQFAYALAPTIPLLYASTVFQVAFAIYTPAIVDYVASVIPAKDLAKGQTLAYSMTTVGAVFASLIGGKLYDTISVRATLLTAACVCVAGAAVCVSALKMKNKADGR